MDKRSFINVLFGQSKKVKSQSASTSVRPLVVTTLTPYTGPWTFAEAAHLLRRTTFGPTYAAIIRSVNEGIESTVEKLVADQALPDPPINFFFENDPTTPIGETWVDQPHDATIANLNTSRNVSLNGWQMGLMNEGGSSIREKLVLFWHNHFVTSDINLAGYNYDYINTLRRNALGNFRTLTEEITVSPSMLLYLNGNENTRQAANENYSRELLELFTIGKGDAAGPGDYTNYTEDDVVSMARALTGWRSLNRNGSYESLYVRNRHDTGTKQLSHRFGNVVIQDEGEEEYKKVIDIILQQDETARFISRRLHVWFVGANIDADVEANIIEPMAALIRENDYNIQPALKALLLSDYFYQDAIRGCMVNHPIDFVFKLFNSFEIEMPDSLLDKYGVWVQIYRVLQDLDMVILNHPSVAGWKAFHQAPQYYDVWANSVSLPQREKIIETLLNGFRRGGQLIKIDPLSVVGKLDNATDPNLLIIGLTNLLFPYAISQGQIDFLKEILIPGLPDFEWTVEYGEYLSDPTNSEKREGVETKLRALFGTILKMPEMYLI